MTQTTPTERAPSGRSPTTPPEPPHATVPYGMALLAGGGVFALYAITLAPSTAFWDASEYIATAHILGIPHPPGNPLFVIMARAWELLLAPTGLSVAVRVNLFSALMTAGASVFWFLVVYRILSYFTVQELVRRVGAGAGVLLSATAFTVWNQSNVNEKVYTVSLLTIALLSWLAFLWRDHVEEHRGIAPKKSWHDDNVLVLMVFLLALSVGNHLMAFLAAPALLVLILMVKPKVLANWRLYAWGLVFGIVGISVHLYLPIRAGLGPIINEADPTCASLGEAIVSVLTLGAAGCEELSAALAREQYAKPPVTERLAPFWAQLMNYFQYFDWQWSRSLMGSQGWLAPARMPFTLLFLGLGGYGAWQHSRRDRISFAFVATLFATLSFGLIFYLNFKYGYGQSSAYGLPLEVAEVRERDYFFIVSFSVWGLWAGVGLAALWLEGARKFAGDERSGLVRAAPIMGLALLPMVLNWSYASRAGEYAARDWAYNLLNSVEPYGVLFTNGDNDTFPLWYIQEVEGVRRDVTVIVWSYLNTPWYAKQLRELTRPCDRPGEAAIDRTRIICQREFVPETAASIYTEARYPGNSILPLTDADIETVTRFGYAPITEDVVFEARGVRVPIPAGSILMAADQFILSIIRHAWGDRPIYFAMTTAAHRNLGFSRYVARQGLAFRLITPEEAAAENLLAIPAEHTWTQFTGAYVDVERTRQLLWEEFQYRDLLRWSRWPDDATRGIPSYYGYSHVALSVAEQELGNEEELTRNLQRADEWLALSER